VYTWPVLQVEALAPLETYPRGKFVVLERGSDPHQAELHIVFGPVNEFPYHANIVYEYLVTRGRAQAVMTDGSHCRVTSPGWRILGGGQYRLDDLTHTVHLNEKSTAYGKYPQQRLADFDDQLPTALGLEGWALELD
jgi:hypothetical protein